jgi:hypothetical protein
MAAETLVDRYIWLDLVGSEPSDLDRAVLGNGKRRADLGCSFADGRLVVAGSSGRRRADGGCGARRGPRRSSQSRAPGHQIERKKLQEEDGKMRKITRGSEGRESRRRRRSGGGSGGGAPAGTVLR